MVNKSINKWSNYDMTIDNYSKQKINTNVGTER